ncbi:hypothetical protein HOLleu_44431 [Holothuria leucospilota]|uniref:Uncharacterized protein n=1 Tax=Holothuria leucospilota TaxID=206669 RepID=A0A9Q0YCG6_HOLLE|nr:hypothetical protein HOLleu_44431 [Holothuria leucospilota]
MFQLLVKKKNMPRQHIKLSKVYHNTSTYYNRAELAMSFLLFGPTGRLTSLASSENRTQIVPDRGKSCTKFWCLKSLLHCIACPWFCIKERVLIKKNTPLIVHHLQF